MRLIDGDALAERAVYANLSTEVVDVLVDLIDAAPTVACERCEHHKPKFNDVSYPWCSPVGYHHQDFGCVYFQPSDAGGAG